MSYENLTDTHEREPKIVSIPSATETLLHLEQDNSPWPTEITTNEVLLRQAEQRNKTVESLVNVFSIIPDVEMGIDVAVENGLVAQRDLTETYNNLCDILVADPNSNRMLLYFPFEMVPDAKWRPESPELRVAQEKFMKVYMEKWSELLLVDDVRANFVDGDVLEIDLQKQPLERVTKAAHLIPQLIQKGYLSLDDITELIKDNPDTVLQQSIVDTLPVLVDMNILSQQDIDQIISDNSIVAKENTNQQLSPDEITPARAKWLSEKNEIPNVSGSNQAKLDISFEERSIDTQEEIQMIRKIIGDIESDPELSDYIYPVSIMFGSRMKGYSNSSSDLDVGVFIKPGTKREDGEKISELLSKVFSGNEIEGKVAEFWLQQNGDDLQIVDMENSRANIAESTWTHILFGGTFVGDENVIKEIHAKLLPQYLHQSSERRTYLEEMERDILQYRLMHKGYAKFFERKGGINVSSKDKIDGDSVFYDSGYRRLATKLFLSKVFLPTLE